MVKDGNMASPDSVVVLISAIESSVEEEDAALDVSAHVQPTPRTSKDAHSLQQQTSSDFVSRQDLELLNN